MNKQPSDKDSRNSLAEAVDWIGEVFERLSPSLFRFLAAFLPYLSPVPVSVVTASSAGKFLQFDTPVAFILVFVLGGIGLWFTSLLVDAVVDYIRGENFMDWKSLSVVILFTVAILTYIGVEVGLNVAIHTEDTTPQRQVVLFLLSMLPLITGVGNGYYKLKLQQNLEAKEEKRKQEDLDERRHQEKREDRLKGKLIAQGINPLVTQYQSSVPSPLPQPQEKPKKDDWRLLTRQERHEVKHVLTIKEVMDKYPVSRATVYNWKDDKKYKLDE